MFVRKHLRPQTGMKILDIGCGTADVLRKLPKVRYVGFDINRDYIRTAKKSYRGQGVFLVRQIEKMKKAPYQPYDLVLAQGLIHHLPDAAALHLLQFARRALRSGGRLVTLDGVLTPRQGFWARYFVSHDRGRHVRTLSAYRALFRRVFPKATFFVYDNLLRFPYTLLMVEASRTHGRSRRARPVKKRGNPS